MFKGWVASLGMLAVILAMVAMGFAVERSSTVADARARSANPAAFLRALEPGASLVHEYDALDELSSSRLDGPGMRELMRALGDDHRLYLAVPLSLFPAGQAASPTAAEALVLVGESPPGLERRTQPGIALLWGSLDGLLGSETSQPTLHGVPVQQVDESPPRVTILDGSGHAVELSAQQLVAIDATTAVRWGIGAPSSIAEIASAVVCLGCTEDEMSQLAGAMTEAERANGDDLAFFAYANDDPRTPARAIWALGDSLERQHLVAVLVTLGFLILAGAHNLYGRRRSAFRIDRLAGASRGQIHLRVQALLGMAMTLPATMGLIGLHGLMVIGDIENRLRGGALLGLLAVPLMVHGLVGASLAVRLVRDPDVGRRT